MKKRQSGIYQIQCKATGERYIGSSIDIPARFVEHRYDLNLSNHHNYKLLAEWERHGGEDGFEFSVIEECPPEQVIEREQHWLDTLKPELNISTDSRRPSLGLKRKQSTIDKMSIAHLNRHAKNSPERKEQIRQNIVKGRQRWWVSLSPEEQEKFQKSMSHPHTEETKRILSEKSRAYNPRRDKKFPGMSLDAIDNMRRAQKDQREAARVERETNKAIKQAEFDAGREVREILRREKLSIANSGKTLTLEQKQHLREVALAQQQDPEYKARHEAGLRAAMNTPEMHAKLSKAHKGKVLTPEHKEAIRIANVGKHSKPRSEEAKQRMSEAQQKRWARDKQK